jgi:hypothetical protein
MFESLEKITIHTILGVSDVDGSLKVEQCRCGTYNVMPVKSHKYMECMKCNLWIEVRKLEDKAL